MRVSRNRRDPYASCWIPRRGHPKGCQSSVSEVGALKQARPLLGIGPEPCKDLDGQYKVPHDLQSTAPKTAANRWGCTHRRLKFARRESRASQPLDVPPSLTDAGRHAEGYPYSFPGLFGGFLGSMDPTAPLQRALWRRRFPHDSVTTPFRPFVDGHAESYSHEQHEDCFLRRWSAVGRAMHPHPAAVRM
jgi:hypothetical protein